MTTAVASFEAEETTGQLVESIAMRSRAMRSRATSHNTVSSPAVEKIEQQHAACYASVEFLTHRLRTTAVLIREKGAVPSFTLPADEDDTNAIRIAGIQEKTKV